MPHILVLGLQPMAFPCLTGISVITDSYGPTTACQVLFWPFSPGLNELFPLLLPRDSQTSRSGRAATLNCAAIVNDVWAAARRKCYLLIGRVREHFLEGMPHWRVLRRELEEHPAHMAHLQRTANSQEPERDGKRLHKGDWKGLRREESSKS